MGLSSPLRRYLMMPVTFQCIIHFRDDFNRTNIAELISECRKFVGFVVLAGMWSPWLKNRFVPLLEGVVVWAELFERLDDTMTPPSSCNMVADRLRNAAGLHTMMRIET